MKIPKCALCTTKYARARMHFGDRSEDPRYFLECGKCAYYVEIDQKKYQKYTAGTDGLTGVTSPDWSPWKDRHNGNSARDITAYPGPPRERYCKICKRRPLASLWAMDAHGPRTIHYGVCPHCGDNQLNSVTYARLKKFGLPEAPYHHALQEDQRSPEAPPLPGEGQKLLTDFVKVRKRRARKK